MIIGERIYWSVGAGVSVGLASVCVLKWRFFFFILRSKVLFLLMLFSSAGFAFVEKASSHWWSVFFVSHLRLLYVAVN